MPRLLFATSQMAMNQAVSGSCVLSIIVPFVAENCLGHLVHCHLRAWPLAFEQVVHPHLGHTNPAGCISCSRRLSHASSSGHLLTRSASVPLFSHSALLLPPACLYAIFCLHRTHRSLAYIMQHGSDRNSWPYALCSEPLSAIPLSIILTGLSLLRARSVHRQARA